MTTVNLDAIRAGVLDRMERGARTTRLALFGAALLEALLLAVAILLIDWDDRLQKLLFVFFVLSYSIVVLGLVALAGHVTRAMAQLLAALDAGGAR